MADPTDLRLDASEFLNFFPHRAPHIMWLLGAGSSVGAGLPSAGVLTWEFKRAIYCNRHRVSSSQFKDLYDPQFQSLVQSYFDSQAGHPKINDDAEYSFYFERYLSDEGDRRRFLDSRLRGTKPSFGHLCLAALHALDQSRVIWTTNFDPLVERAMGQDTFSGHFPGGVTVASLECPDKARDSIHDERWPLLVKLHGDFQYRKLMNTERELLKQNEVLEKCLIDQCNRMGLAAVGYSGRDNSIMSVLTQALSGSSPFPHGLFWFVRNGTVPGAQVITLLNAAKSRGVQAGFIEIGGFDELMADLFLPHHERLPEVRDIVKKSRTRRALVPAKYVGGTWPIIRTNALEVVEYPSTCTIFQSSIGGSKEVKDLISPHQDRIAAQRKEKGVIAFATRADLENVFQGFQPTEFDVHSIAPNRLRYADSAEYGLLYHALIQGIASATGLSRSQNYRGRVLFFSSNPQPRTTVSEMFKQQRASAVRSLGKSGPFLHQAIDLSLDFCDNRLWLLLEPTLYVTTDGKLPFTGEGRQELGREDLIRRYNSKMNDWLKFWIEFLKSHCGDPMKVTFPSQTDHEATFRVSCVSAFARRS